MDAKLESGRSGEVRFVFVLRMRSLKRMLDSENMLLRNINEKIY